MAVNHNVTDRVELIAKIQRARDILSTAADTLSAVETNASENLPYAVQKAAIIEALEDKCHANLYTMDMFLSRWQAKSAPSPAWYAAGTTPAQAIAARAWMTDNFRFLQEILDLIAARHSMQPEEFALALDFKIKERPTTTQTHLIFTEIYDDLSKYYADIQRWAFAGSKEMEASLLTGIGNAIHDNLVNSDNFLLLLQNTNENWNNMHHIDFAADIPAIVSGAEENAAAILAEAQSLFNCEAAFDELDREIGEIYAAIFRPQSSIGDKLISDHKTIIFATIFFIISIAIIFFIIHRRSARYPQKYVR